MKLWMVTLSAVGVMGVAAPAAAQDSGFPALLATSLEGVGQTIGEAAMGGQSIFLTAHGQAKLPAPLTGSYFVNVDGKSASASEAARTREAKLAQLRTVAQKFGVEMEIGDSRFSLETDTVAQQRRIQAVIQENAALPVGAHRSPLPTDTPPKLFLARTGVRFREPSADRLPAFLDAVRTAGVDDIHTGPSAPPVGLAALASSQEVLGFGAVEKIDDAIWDAAETDAVRVARRQAQTLAAASNRTLGPVRQILFLSRGVQNGEAVVTLAVRFGLVN